MSTVERRLEQFCVAMEDSGFAEASREVGAEQIVERLVTALEHGLDIREVERALDGVDDAFARGGLGPVTGDAREYRPLSALSGHITMRAWVCPTDQCERVLPHNNATAPRCAVLRRPLRLVGISS